ncbi:MAG: DUF3892 domain-containing protein [Bacteroidales bacterium]|jgi:hypothetical protein|nr:DUF3892 domain-containing protein [Bacteroidales bacterium]
MKEFKDYLNGEATYYVTGANKDKNNDRIEKVEVRKIHFQNLNESETFNRDRIILMIENKTAEFHTALGDMYLVRNKKMTEKDSWKKGAKVEIVSANGIIYLRTAGNYSIEDNLGELPEF